MPGSFARACAALWVLAVATAGAQKPTVLFGVVTNVNGVRLVGVEMALANTTLRVVTNDSGEYLFAEPPTGRLRLTARRIGFKPLEKGFKLDAGDSRAVDFELEGLPDLLDSVLVLGRGGSARMAEFWTRRAIGVGAFITRADIERRKPYRPSDLLRTVSGVRVGNDNLDGRPAIRMGRVGLGAVARKNVVNLAADCRVSYYVDGIWVPPGTFHIDDMSPGSIEAIEIYRGPAESPPRFRQRDTACGLIAIWTREPPPRERPDAARGGSRRA